MYNTKFILIDGSSRKDIYPGYLDKNTRLQIKNKYKGKQHFLCCGCKPNEELYYKISEDLRIYPEKMNYVHDEFCCRYQKAVKPPYKIDEDGNVTVNTSFDPRNFSRIVKKEPEEQEKELEEKESTENNNILIESDTSIAEDQKEKEPQLDFKGLCRCINVDCFTNNVLNNLEINNKQSFSVSVYHRMKTVKLARTKKSIGNLSLETDGVKFIYTSYAGIKKKEYSTFIETKSNDGRIFRSLTYPDIAEKAVNDFIKQYGIEPNQDTMIAAFQYLKKNKTTGEPYRVLGRVHLFLISNIGIYCRTLTEYNAFNSLYRICSNNHNIRFWIPPEDDSIGAIIEIKGYNKKILLTFKSKKDGNVKYNDDYIPFIVSSSTMITEKILLDLLQK